MTTTGTSITVPLTGQEWKALDELAQKQDISPARVMVQALRLYQAVTLGHLKITETEPMLRLQPPWEDEPK